MTLDRAELAGTGAALVFHVALIAALSMSLASVSAPPEPPAMEVELVEEVGLQSSAPSPASPPPPSQAPETSPIVEPAPAPRIEAPPPPPVIAPPAPPRPAPAPARQPVAKAPPAAKPTPAKPKASAPSRPAAPARPAPRVSRIGDDFLSGIESSDAPSRPFRLAAATFNAQAKASVAALFQRLVQPCANKQVNPGDGANRIRVTVNLRLRPNGTLAGTPQIVRVTGVDDDNERYEERVKDLAVAVYRECSPFAGLPSDLYRTPQGGWSNINLTYKLP